MTRALKFVASMAVWGALVVIGVAGGMTGALP